MAKISIDLQGSDYRTGNMFSVISEEWVKDAAEICMRTLGHLGDLGHRVEVFQVKFKRENSTPIILIHAILALRGLPEKPMAAFSTNHYYGKPHPEAFAKIIRKSVSTHVRIQEDALNDVKSFLA